jgi:hypothetical protein
VAKTGIAEVFVGAEASVVICGRDATLGEAVAAEMNQEGLTCVRHT